MSLSPIVSAFEEGWKEKRMLNAKSSNGAILGERQIGGRLIWAAMPCTPQSLLNTLTSEYMFFEAYT